MNRRDKEVEDTSIRILVRFATLVGEIMGLGFGLWIGSLTGVIILAIVWTIMALLFTWWDVHKLR